MQDDNNTFLPENKPDDQKKEGKTYKLKRPFEFEGDTISEVNIKEMTAGDMMAAERESSLVRKSRGYTEPAGDFEKTGYLVAKLTGLTIDAVEKMHSGDFMELNNMVSDFLD